MRSKVAALALSLAGIAFIQGWEGTRPVAYLDVVGVPTICTGSTRNVFIGQTATLGECEARLVQDTTYAGRAIQRCTKVKLTQGQYDALVSFVFNIGGGAYCTSSLLRELNQGHCRAAGAWFLAWDHAGGQRIRGLTNRRRAESVEFLKGCE